MLNEWINKGQTTIPNVLIENYQKIGISHAHFLLLIQLLSSNQLGKAFPDMHLIASYMNTNEESLYDQLNYLVQNKIISVETIEENGKKSERLSFDPLWSKLESFIERQQKKSIQSERSISTNSLYQIFEEEFGRPLSPIELETIGIWLDENQYSPELIYMALRESILNQVYSLNYIDRILLSWEKQNITTKEQVEQKSREFRRQKYAQSEAKDEQKKKHRPSVPLINWLDHSE